MKNLNDLIAVCIIFSGIIIFAYQCQKENCEIYGAWERTEIANGDTTRFVYCFTKDSMIVVIKGKNQSGRLSIPIVVGPDAITINDAKGQVWPYENTCDTLLLKTSEGLQTFSWKK